ncbi:MAG: MarR family transcriptional regulator [Zoogloeaceae bacterium]|jgi:MarR family transcriptional regulator for hemolysin|nr:MarR family transcriptional regulator [Zoogloeaceae bacterium]
MQQRHFTFSRLLHRVGSAWRAQLNGRLRSWNIDMTTWQMLSLLQQENIHYNQYMLASRLGIETSYLVRLLDRLEKRNLLKRQTDPQDRRQKHILITPDGLALLGEIEAEIARLREAVLADISMPELENGMRLLEQILRNVTQITSNERLKSEAMQ